MIHFKMITTENFHACIQLDTGIDEQYLMPIVDQIALSYVYPTKIPLAIYDDDQLIGFVSYEIDEEPEKAYDILVIVIDRRLQGQGYGTKAMNALIQYLRNMSKCNVITLNHHSDNTAAHRLYTKMGFVNAGRINARNNEIVMRLEL